MDLEEFDNVTLRYNMTNCPGTYCCYQVFCSPGYSIFCYRCFFSPCTLRLFQGFLSPRCITVCYQVFSPLSLPVYSTVVPGVSCLYHGVLCCLVTQCVWSLKVYSGGLLSQVCFCLSPVYATVCYQCVWSSRCNLLSVYQVVLYCSLPGGFLSLSKVVLYCLYQVFLSSPGVLYCCLPGVSVSPVYSTVCYQVFLSLQVYSAVCYQVFLSLQGYSAVCYQVFLSLRCTLLSVTRCFLSLQVYSAVCYQVYSTVYSIITVVRPGRVTVFALLVLVKTFRQRSAFHIYMLNLAVSDLLCVSTLPLRVLYYVNKGQWNLGDFLCRVSSYALYVNLYCSVFFMTAMSVTRFLAINLRLVSERRARLVCVCIWVFICTVSSPFLMTGQHLHPATNKTKCFEPPERSTRGGLNKLIMLNYFSLAVGFVLPFLVILLCYAGIIRALLSRQHTAQRQKGAGV
ncbi:unnamed protein product, partial [Coregonus sp. 'balchen']